MNQEFTSNNWHTYLIGNGGGINPTQTTFRVVQVTGAPATPFRMVVGPATTPDPSEIMLCTAISGTTLTVVRGYEAVPGVGAGVGVAHLDGEEAAATITAAGLAHLLVGIFVQQPQVFPFTALSSVVCNHNLNRIPVSVVIVDGSGNEFVGGISNPTNNQTVVTFAAPQSGTVYIA